MPSYPVGSTCGLPYALVPVKDAASLDALVVRVRVRVRDALVVRVRVRVRDALVVSLA